MAQANYTQIERALIARDNFKGNSCFGVWIGSTYTVTSYNTVIATIDGDGALYFNTTKYSNTTSRLQNLIRKSWGIKD